MVKFNIPTALDLMKSVPNAKYEWKRKSPKEKWCYLYGILKNAFDLIRWPVYDNILEKLHWFAHYISAYTIFWISLMLYTVCYHAFRGNYFQSLICTCGTVLLIATGPIIYNMTTKNRFKMTSLSIFGGLYIYQDRDFEDSEYNRICSHYMDKTMKSFLIKISVMSLSLAASEIGTFYAYVSHGLKATTFCYRIPFTELDSDAEFIVNVIFQINACMHAGLAYIGMEVWMSLVENIVLVVPAIFELKMKQMCEPFKSKSISHLQMRSMFRNLVMQSTDADDFVAEVSDMLYYRTLLTPIVFTYSIGMCIFCQRNVGFPAGYGIAGMTWVQLFYVCELGENIQDNGFAEILFRVEWYVLPLDIQKEVMHLINRKQNVSGIKLGPFGAGINRDVFKVCTNKIYTLVMFLKRFNE